MVMQHPINMNVRGRNNLILVDDAPAILVGEVAAPKANSFVHAGNWFAGFAVCMATLFQLGTFALQLRQSLLVNPKEAGTPNRNAAAKYGKLLQSNINAHDFRANRQWCEFWKLTTNRHVPFTRAAHTNAHSLGRTEGWPVQDYFNVANLRQVQGIAVELCLVAVLGVAEAIVSALTTKARITRLLASFHPPEERFHAKVNTHCHVLQHLAVYLLQVGTFILQGNECGLLVIE